MNLSNRHGTVTSDQFQRKSRGESPGLFVTKTLIENTINRIAGMAASNWTYAVRCDSGVPDELVGYSSSMELIWSHLTMAALQTSDSHSAELFLSATLRPDDTVRLDARVRSIDCTVTPELLESLAADRVHDTDEKRLTFPRLMRQAARCSREIGAGIKTCADDTDVEIISEVRCLLPRSMIDG